MQQQMQRGASFLPPPSLDSTLSPNILSVGDSAASRHCKWDWSTNNEFYAVEETRISTPRPMINLKRDRAEKLWILHNF